MLVGSSDPLDQLGKIDRSLRLRSSVPSYLTKTFAAPTNQLKWTWFGWVKGASPNATQSLFISGIDSSFPTFSGVQLQSNKIYVAQDNNGTISWDILTDRVLRDYSQHYFLMVSFDATQAVASDRVKVYINGDLATVSGTYPSQNVPCHVNGSGYVHMIGATFMGGGVFGQYASATISGYGFVDGQALTPSSVGQAHPLTGQWRPKAFPVIKAVVDSGGTNSFLLPFNNTTNTTTLGLDGSSKGNNWTANNISLNADATYDSSLDTPTTGFATLNPLQPVGTLSNGNLTFTSGTGAKNVMATIPMIKGKFYWEVKHTDSNSVASVGVNDINGSLSSNLLDAGNVVGWSRNNGSIYVGASIVATAAYTNADTLSFAYDSFTGKLWAAKNGIWISSGNPETGANPIATLNYTPVPAVANANSSLGSIVEANFGQRPFAYTPPAGYKALCSKNLVRPRPLGSSVAFGKSTGTGSTITSNIAAKRAGWGTDNYLEWFKRTDSAEGHFLRFSDDSANYMDTSSTAAKAAWPGLTAGGAYVGWVFRFNPAFGANSGTFNHVNGTNSVIADGLGKTQKAIILRKESGGDWYYYHPAIAAGSLMYLNLPSGSTADTRINTVTSTGFTVDGALSSGTYRWIAIADGEYFKIGSYVGTGVDDGPFVPTLGSPGWSLIKAPRLNGFFTINDTARSPTNVNNLNLYTHSTAGNNTNVPAYDSVSGGIKLRSGSSGDNANYTGDVITYIVVNDSPFRYSNAR